MEVQKQQHELRNYYSKIAENLNIQKADFNGSFSITQAPLREKYPHSEFFLPAYSRIWTKYGPENSEYGHFLSSAL